MNTSTPSAWNFCPERGAVMNGLNNGASGGNAVFRLRRVRKIREKGGVSFELCVPSFSVERGQFVALVGPSGCGKSTLLDLLGLVLRPTSAEEFLIWINIRGVACWQNVSALNDEELAKIRKTHIGYVLQTGGLLPFISVRDNILLTCSINGLTGQEGTVKQIAERLGIVEQLSKKPKHLSSGQRQRAAIARALAHRPPIILADEPTAAVDKHTAIEIRNEFKELTKQMGVTLLMVTHDQRLVADEVDRTFEFIVQRQDHDLTVSTVVERLEPFERDAID